MSPAEQALPPGATAAELAQAEATGRRLSHVATRFKVGDTDGVGAVVRKDGLRTWRYRAGQLEETLVLGGACSEVFSGPVLAKALRPAVEHQQQALQRLAAGEACAPLSMHTSVGLPSAFGAFLEALEPHLPWEAADGWFVNLQVEGTTAVWAGVEALMRRREVEGLQARPCVAVAEKSYHGPKTTGLGLPAAPRWPGAPAASGQLAYPVPQEGRDFLAEFRAFLERHGEEVGVAVFEPQWGSSFAGRPWDKELLLEAVRMARERGILVLCDEIMCGLGRHGEGTLFLSGAWGLKPDAVTFGKAVAAGAYPMSGVAVRGKALREAGANLKQSHTYAGASALALLTAAEVLRELPAWFRHARSMGALVGEKLQGNGLLSVEGKGLMWGGLFTAEEEERRRRGFELLCEACAREGVWPYLLNDGAGSYGFMLSPPMNVEEMQLREGLERLARCIAWAKAELA